MGGPEPPKRSRDRRRPGDTRLPQDRRNPTSARLSKSVQAPYFPADDEGDRHRTRIVSSSPLKRIEEEERELQHRQESARVGLRLTIVGLIVLVAFSAVVVRLWSLQVLHSSQYRNAALVFQQQTVPITPARGLIIARGGQVLVGDQVLPVVTLSRSTATQVVVGRLAALLGESITDVNTALANPQASPYQPVPIAIGVSQSTIVYLSEHESMFPGVSVNFTAERTYPRGDIASQVLGYTGDIDAAELHSLAKYGYTPNDVVGQSGVEATDELWLRGRPGSEVIKVDASGNPVGTVKTTAPVSGDDVVLNIDLDLQKTVESALTRQIQSLQASGLPADSGAAVVLDPSHRCRFRHGLGAHLQPVLVGRRHLRPALPALDEPGRPRPSAQPGDPGTLGARFHLQARDRDGGPERRAVGQPRGLHRRPRLLPDPAPLQRAMPLLQQPGREGPGPDQRRDGAHGLRRRVLLHPRSRLLVRLGRLRPDADPRRRRAVRLRAAHRDRPPQRVLGPG